MDRGRQGDRRRRQLHRLVGSYEQVADALLDYVDLGVSTLLIRGFDPLADARDYGRLVGLVRDGAARRSGGAPTQDRRSA